MFLLLLLRKTQLNPSSAQIPSLLCITCRLFSNHNSENPKKSPIYDEPSSASYDELINTAASSRDLTTVHRLLNKRYKAGLFNTSKTFNFLTQANIDTDLDDLFQTLSTLDKGFARRNAFDCLISRLCKLNRVHDSLRIIDSMIEKGIEVNQITFRPVLYAFTRKHEFDEAWRVIATMKGLGLSVDIISYNDILTSYCYVGDLIGAARVLEGIQNQGLKADSRTYDGLVLGACKAGKVDGALVLLRRMEEEGVPPLYSTLLMVIKSLLGMACYEQAIKFVMAFAGRQRGLDTENFGYLGFHLIQKNRVGEAKLILGEMDKRGLVMGDKLRSQYDNLMSDSN